MVAKVRGLCSFMGMALDPPTYIIGHRNPDADAICSAIGYAALKHLRGEKQCVAARCGNSNARIDAILNRFGVPLPPFVGDVTPRVRDVMVRDVRKVSREAICAEALELMDRYDVRVLPVVDAEGQLHGALSIFDLGDYFIPKPSQERRMRRVVTSLNDIVRALRGEVLHMEDPNREEELFVRIGAMDIRSFGKFYAADAVLARSSVIVVGDRYDIQQKSIRAGVRLIVITGGLPVEDDVIAMAKECGVSMVVSPNDSATTSWMIRSAARVDAMTRKDFMTFGADEKLAIARRRIAAQKDAPAYMVVDDAGRLIGIFTKTDLLKPSRTSLILVDHNELSQAVPGADQVNILEVIDHHRLGNAPTQQPILFINRPVGSTSTIVTDLFRKEGFRPDSRVAGVLMGGIISDTLNLRGPTTTELDSEMLEWLSGIAGCPGADLAETIFSSGSVVLTRPADDVIRSDMKTYTEGEVRFSVSQVEELGFDNFWSHREALEQALNAIAKADGLFFAALLVTDINTQNSLLLVSGGNEFVESIPYPRKDSGDVFELSGIVSRKKQVMPFIATILHSMGVTSTAALASSE